MSGTVQAARTQARRRLVGALVLMLIGIVGFPVLFETQPRPLPMDTPIELPRREAPVVSPRDPVAGSTSKAAPIRLPPADAGNEIAAAPAASAAPPASAVAEAAPKAAPVETAAASVATPRSAVPAPVAVASAASVAATKVAAASSPGAKPATPASAAAPVAVAVATAAASSAASDAAPTRFVVQAGAYIDTAKLRDARAKIEALGLKTYTQEVDSSTGRRTRVRIGPYATRAEAEAMAAKVKKTGLPTAVLAL